MFAKARFLDTRKFVIVENAPKDLKMGEYLVIEDEEKGKDLAFFVGFSKENELKRVKFVEVLKDKNVLKEIEKEDRRAFEVFKRLYKKHNLPLRPLKAHFTYDKKKVFFYYVAETRIDFRQLVKDLARIFKRRIEMRQVGVRDAIVMMGWVGLCGELPCCYRFIERFNSISLVDIFEQRLPTGPQKYTGICGRLMCCLSFERENYRLSRFLPQEGTEIGFKGKTYRVASVNPLKEEITLKAEKEVITLPISQVLPKDYTNIIRRCKNCCKSYEDYSPKEELPEYPLSG